MIQAMGPAGTFGVPGPRDGATMEATGEPPTAARRGSVEPRVRLMRPGDADEVARLHVEGIPTGLLAELGAKFLARVYRALAECEEGFVFVATCAGDRVVGFVAGVTSVRAMYKRVLQKHGLSFGLAALKYVFSARMIRRILNTLRYPAKVESQYPDAELLSIVVAPEARGSGAATALLEALLAEFHARSVGEIKVMVGPDLERANAYYRKHGFRLAGQITSHGHPANIYTLDTKSA